MAGKGMRIRRGVDGGVPRGPEGLSATKVRFQPAEQGRLTLVDEPTGDASNLAVRGRVRSPAVHRFGRLVGGEEVAVVPPLLVPTGRESGKEGVVEACSPAVGGNRHRNTSTGGGLDGILREPDRRLGELSAVRGVE
jgi:hypothetical protein